MTISNCYLRHLVGDEHDKKRHRTTAPPLSLSLLSTTSSHISSVPFLLDDERLLGNSATIKRCLPIDLSLAVSVPMPLRLRHRLLFACASPLPVAVFPFGVLFMATGANGGHQGWMLGSCRWHGRRPAQDDKVSRPVVPAEEWEGNGKRKALWDCDKEHDNWKCTGKRYRQSRRD